MLLGLALLSSAACTFVVPPAELAPAPYAQWAHYHWVWLSSDQSNQQNVSNYVKEYFDHNITVGAVDIDSGWSTGFNNFIVDTAVFPDLGGLVSELHAQNVNVILWATSMIDTDSTNFPVAVNNSYMLLNAFGEFSTVKWWHGDGGFLDYTNPEALSWWHSQLDNVLSLGIDGFKVDGTDPYMLEYIAPKTSAGQLITYREYADAYYSDFFNYTRSQNGPHCLMWSRPVDSYTLDNVIGAYLTFSPRDVLFSGWVGDQDPTFEGFQDAMTNIIYSAWYNYVNFGSDIGGYRSDGPAPLGRTQELFTRWFEAMAFMPLMENGGDNEHRPWKFDSNGTTNTTDTYRLFVNAHYELVPYLYTTGTQAFEGNTSAISPRQPIPADLWLIQIPNITDYSYFLGSNILVSPVMASNVTWMNVTMPTTSKWFSYFEPAVVYPPGVTVNVSCPLNTIPVFGRTGAILPLNVSTSDVGHGDCSFSSALTLLIHSPDKSGLVTTQEVREFQAGGLVVTYQVTSSLDASGSFDITFTTSAHSWALALLFRGVSVTPQSALTTTVVMDDAMVELDLKPGEHASGLLRGASVTTCSAPAAPAWSFSAATATRSATDEVLVRLPATVTGGGTRTILRNVVLQ